MKPLSNHARLMICWFFPFFIFPCISAVARAQSEQLSVIKAKAEGGDAAAQYYLGLAYSYGLDVPKNDVEAVKWFRKAADQGDADAQYNLGLKYGAGEGVPKNYAESAKWLRMAAERGNVRAQSLLASYCFYGVGVAKDHAQAIRWFRKAAEQGDAEAQFNVGEAYKQGEEVPADYAEALRWYRKSADQGFAQAQTELGWAYHQGNGVAKDYAEALRWLRKAADQNYAAAQRILGQMYYNGEGVNHDIVEAYQWFIRAAPRDQGATVFRNAIASEMTPDQIAEGQRRAAAPIQNQTAVTDPAFQELKEAADQGSAQAQQNLAFMYHEGQGVPQDYAEAAKWFRKAADQGSAYAQYALGFLYSRGEGLHQDDAEAVKWFRKAADQGYAPAQDSLGNAYSSGKGVPQDSIEAYKWFNLAALQGRAGDAASRDNLAKNMTPDQIAEAQRRTQMSDKRQPPPTKPGTPVVPPSVQPNPPQDIQPSVQASGTGFFITADGYLLTNFHVVDKATRIVVRAKQETYEASVITTDAVNDVALLKVSGTFKALPIASSRSVRLGDSIFTIGFPNPEIQGVEAKLTKGEINSLSGIQDDPRYFQISAPVQPGNSGGPVVNEFGNVVGIVTLRLDDLKALNATGSLPQNVNYAIKSTFANAFLETIPEVITKLKEPYAALTRKSSEIIQEAQEATALILVLGNSVPTQNPDSRSEIAASFNQNNYLKAERLSRAALDRNPEDVSALFFLGMSLYKMGRLDEAIAVLQRAGFAAPRDQDAFSCSAGKLLGLTYFSRWLSASAASDFQNAVKWLQSSLSCQSLGGMDKSASSTDQNPAAQFFASCSSELKTAQGQALAKLADTTGTWVEVGWDGRDYGEHRLQQEGSTLTIKMDHSSSNPLMVERFEAKLAGSGHRFSGYGKFSESNVLESCNFEYDIVLDLSEDFQYLKGIKTITRWSGVPKISCQDIVRIHQEHKGFFLLRRK